MGEAGLCRPRVVDEGCAWVGLSVGLGWIEGRQDWQDLGIVIELVKEGPEQGFVVLQGTFFLFSFSHTFTFQLLDKPWSQVSPLLPPRFLPSIFVVHRVQQSHCSSNFHLGLLTHALALSASQFVHKKKS